MNSTTGVPLAPQRSIGTVFAACSDADIADRIRANIASACHHVLALAVASFGKLAALAPDHTPLIERQKERNSAQLGVMLMRRVGRFFRIVRSPNLHIGNNLVTLGSISRASGDDGSFLVILRPLRRARDRFLAVVVIPSELRGKFPLSAIFWISHRFLLTGTVVRGGTGASTSMSSRFYHDDRGGIQL